MNWSKIIIHHSEAKDGQIYDMAAIRRYHNSYRIDGDIVTAEEWNKRKATGQGRIFEIPWGDIGYHFFVEQINGQYEVIVGRPLYISGAHTKDRNFDSIGICLHGNYDIAPPTDDALKVLAKIVRALMELFGLSEHEIYGHRDFADKTCPGKKFDLAEFKRLYL